MIGRLFYDTDSLPDEKVQEVRDTCEALGREMEFGFVMDHLEEERSQGITIDTAQTFFKTERRHYVIIDAPGHKEFIKNMITGASQAEAAILIVDSEEGIQEQTKRHAYILGMLGLRQVMVVLNKMDLVNHSEDRFRVVRENVTSFLGSIDIEPMFVIPISARNGDNVARKGTGTMPWYNGPTVLEALDSFRIREPPTDKPLRFPLQDVYKIGRKRIYVGRIESGKLHTGQEIVFLPGNEITRIRSVEMLWQERKEAVCGESIGITLTDPLFLERGEVACTVDDRPMVTCCLRGNVFWMSKRPFGSGETVVLRMATQEQPVRITVERKMDSSTLKTISDNPEEVRNNEVAQILMESQEPVVVENFNDIQELGRFVLVRDMDVVAGGTITHTREM